jgi:hypothetical protein
VLIVFQHLGDGLHVHRLNLNTLGNLAIDTIEDHINRSQTCFTLATGRFPGEMLDNLVGDLLSLEFLVADLGAVEVFLEASREGLGALRAPPGITPPSGAGLELSVFASHIPVFGQLELA